MPDDTLDTELLVPAARRCACWPSRGMVRSYRKGVVLIEEGSIGDNLYLILSGSLRAYSSDSPAAARSPTASTAPASTSAR